MRDILDVAVINIIFIGCYLINYAAFDTCLSDDVEFYYGKKRLRNRRKKATGIWRKFFFVDIKNEVIKWHYLLFWINFFAFIPMLVSINVFVLSNVKGAKLVFLISGGIYILSLIPIEFARWKLYKGNIVRSRKKYRENNRK